jgi:hypothetical protein
MKLKLVWTACLTAVCLVGAMSHSYAAIVYVDATHGSSGNTAVAPSAGGGVFNPSRALNNQGPANDGLWDVRGFGNGTTIYQNAGTTAAVDNAQRLVTTATVPAGTYNVYAYFWSDSSNSWRLRAGLTDPGTELPLYLPGDPGVTQFYTGADATVFSTTLLPNPFTSSVMIAEGNRRFFQIALGTVSGSSIGVYADDFGAAQTAFNERSWYDGIGYELIPEPTSLALFGASLLALTFRRPIS